MGLSPCRAVPSRRRAVPSLNGALSAWLTLALVAPGGRGLVAQEPTPPDFDLRFECPGSIEGLPGGTASFGASVRLATTPREGPLTSRARAWTLSVRPRGGARVVRATTLGTVADLAPAGLRLPDGYDRTELTFGPGNEGAVSAVILSFQHEAWLPPEGEVEILRLEVEAPVAVGPGAGVILDFEDGLVGSGQPVKNRITFGEGITRRDDGTENDADRDVAEPCTVLVTSPERNFVRGSLNGDSLLNLSDAVFLLEHLFLGGRPFQCAAAADVNGDDIVDLADGAYLLNFLFRGGKAPPAPFPVCGQDPGPVALPCDSSPCVDLVLPVK